MREASDEKFGEALAPLLSFFADDGNDHHQNVTIGTSSTGAA
jgi:hypothetical protein